MRVGAWKAAASVDPVILVKEPTLQQVKGGRGRRRVEQNGTLQKQSRSAASQIWVNWPAHLWNLFEQPCLRRRPSYTRALNHVPDNLSNKSGNSKHKNKKAPACPLKLATRTNATCKLLVSICQGQSRLTQSAEHLTRFPPSGTGAAAAFDLVPVAFADYLTRFQKLSSTKNDSHVEINRHEKRTP